MELYAKSAFSNKHKVIRRPVSSFLNSSTTFSLKYFEATSTGNNEVKSANDYWQLNIHGHLSTLIVMLQLMQVIILLPGTVWSAFVQLMLMQMAPHLPWFKITRDNKVLGVTCHLSFSHDPSVLRGLIRINLVLLYLHHLWQ